MKFSISFWPFINSLNSWCSFSCSLISLNFSWARCFTLGTWNAKITKNKASERTESRIDFLKVLLMTASCPFLTALLASMVCFLIKPTSRKLQTMVDMTIGYGPMKLAILIEQIRTNRPRIHVQILTLQAMTLKDFLWVSIHSFSCCFWTATDGP